MEEAKPTAISSENVTKEQDYLMAYGKKEQRAKGVKGIATNGELETLGANKTSKSQFIRVGRYGNFSTNFGKNFMYQYNHPTRYALYRMEEKTPMEEARRRIKQAQPPESESLGRELSRDNRIYNNHLFNERGVNWQQAERYGLTPDVFRQMGDVERLLQGRQSGTAYDTSMNTELGRQKRDVKFSLFRDENGPTKFDLHSIRQAPKVGQEHRGYKLEEDVLDALNQTGNAGKLVGLVVDFRSKETKPCYLSKDPVTNEMLFLLADQARCPKKIKDYTLSQQEYADYTTGKEVPIEFKSSNRKILQTSIQMSAAERGTELLWERSTERPENRQGQGQRDGSPEKTQKLEKGTYVRKSKIIPKV